MKKLLIFLGLLLLLISPFVVYGSWVFTGGTVAGCTASTPGNDNDEIGHITVGASSTTLSSQRMYAWLYAADCTGDLGTAYVYASSSSASDTKIVVYSTTDTDTESPPTNGTRIGYTGGITMGTVAGWVSGAMSSGSVVAGTKYWLAIDLDANSNTTLFHDSSGISRHYVVLGGDNSDYTTPPATIPLAGGCIAAGNPWQCCTGEGTGCGWSSIEARSMSIFVGIE